MLECERTVVRTEESALSWGFWVQDFTLANLEILLFLGYPKMCFLSCTLSYSIGAEVCSGWMEAGSGFESQMCKWNSSICTTANPSCPWFALWKSSIGPIFLPLPFAWEQTPQRGSRKINSFCSFTCCWHQAGFIGNESFHSFSQLRWRWFRRWRWEVGGFCLNLHPVEALFAASFLLRRLGLFGAAVLIATISL